MPVFAKEILHGGAHTFGFLMAASGVGALWPARSILPRAGAFSVWGGSSPSPAPSSGSVSSAFALSRSFWLSLVLLLRGRLRRHGAGRLQQHHPADHRGGRQAGPGDEPLHHGVHGDDALRQPDGRGCGRANRRPGNLAFGGVVCLAGGLLFARGLPALRKFVRPIYVRMGIIPEVASGIQTAAELTVPPEEL